MGRKCSEKRTAAAGYYYLKSPMMRSDLEPKFACSAWGHRGADARPLSKWRNCHNDQKIQRSCRFVSISKFRILLYLDMHGDNLAFLIFAIALGVMPIGLLLVPILGK